MKSRHFWLSLAAAVLASITLFVVPACQTTQPQTHGSATTEAVLTSLTAPKLRIATFNIANLSVNKLAKAEVSAVLVGLIRKYDVIAVQELDDASLKAPAEFLSKINAVPGARYQMAVSAEGGSKASTGQREQYAVYFNATKVEAMDSGLLFPDPDDDFVREPFAVQLRPKGATTSFVVLTIHTAPDVAPREITALRKASDWAAAHYTGEAGVIVLGDFNGGKRYVPLAKIAEIRTNSLPYLWIVPDDADTTLGSEPQAHDRIIVTGELAKRYTNSWSVDRSFSDTKISDHYPVWAEFDFGGPN